MFDPGERLIFALDLSSIEEVKRWLELLRGEVRLYKVGKQLFLSCGLDAVRLIKDYGGEVFLDLKFHDIPNTVAEASRAAVRMGVEMFTIHALGGLDMMRAARDAVEAESMACGCKRPLILAVTVLTSLDGTALSSIGIERRVEEEVVMLAGLARDAGLDGVIASPNEAELIKGEVGRGFIVATPGIRQVSGGDDQARIATPEFAIKKGSDFLIIGRPIRTSTDPVKTVRDIIKEMEKAVCQD